MLLLIGIPSLAGTVAAFMDTFFFFFLMVTIIREALNEDRENESRNYTIITEIASPSTPNRVLVQNLSEDQNALLP